MAAYPPAMARSSTRWVKSNKVCSMKGRKISSTRRTVSTFGTKVRVISWICVKAWKIETMRPTARPDSKGGAATFTMTSMPDRASSMSSDSVTCRSSDRHLQNVVIGGDHVADIGLAGDRLLGKLLALLAAVDGVLDAVLQQAGEIHAAAGNAFGLGAVGPGEGAGRLLIGGDGVVDRDHGHSGSPYFSMLTVCDSMLFETLITFRLAS